jgi:hypothetical protein
MVLCWLGAAACGDMFATVPCPRVSPCEANQLCVLGQCIGVSRALWVGYADQAVRQINQKIHNMNDIIKPIPKFDDTIYNKAEAVYCRPSNPDLQAGPGFCFKPVGPQFNRCLMSLTSNTLNDGCPGHSCTNASQCSANHTCSPEQLCTLNSQTAIPTTTPVYAGPECLSQPAPAVLIRFLPVPRTATVTVFAAGRRLGSRTCTREGLAPNNCAHMVAAWSKHANQNYLLQIAPEGYSNTAVPVQTVSQDCQVMTTTVPVYLTGQ